MYTHTITPHIQFSDSEYAVRYSAHTSVEMCSRTSEGGDRGRGRRGREGKEKEGGREGGREKGKRGTEGEGEEERRK